MNSFSEYMDKVKAEKELKEKTNAFVCATLSNTEHYSKTINSGLKFKKERFNSKNLLITISALAACMILVLSGNAYYHTSVNYVCLDINPSVELGINAFGRVISTQAYNEDGLQLLGDKKYLNLSLGDAVSILLQDAADQGFIAKDGSTVIAVTAESSNHKSATELQKSSETEVSLAMSAGEISAIVYSDYTDLQLRNQANETGVSPGKLKLILILQTLNPDITIEDYKNTKITNIITKIDELLSKSGDSWQNGNYAETFEKLLNTAEQVQAAEQVQNRKGLQDQSQDSGRQEQNQYPSSNNNGSQNQVQNQGPEIKQQIQNQNSNTGQQQTQSQEEQIQSQESSMSVPGQNQNQEQTTGLQYENDKPVQDNVNSGQISSALTETETATSGGGPFSEPQSGTKKSSK